MAIKLKMVVCAESLAVDQRRNTLSLFHVIEQFNIPSFPFAMPHMIVATLFERGASDPSDYDDVSVHIALGNQELAESKPHLKFLDRPRLRQVADVTNLVIPGPGTLSVIIKQGDEVLGTWTMTVVDTGKTELQAELKLDGSSPPV
jgi:hypothetical protein